MKSLEEKAEYQREWYAKNRERAAEIAARSYAKHRDARREHMLRKNLNDEELERVRFEAKLRHNWRMQTDPAYVINHRLTLRIHRAYNRYGRQPIAKHFWEQIKAFYDQCPLGMEVDHIEPRFAKDGDTVVACGLHVPWNLQYLKPRINAGKGSRSAAVGTPNIKRKYPPKQDKKAYDRARYLRLKAMKG